MKAGESYNGDTRWKL